MCIKVSLQKISLAGLALALTLSNLNANEKQLGEYDSNLLLKKAVLKLYRENQELEKRVGVLEDKLGIKKPDQNSSVVSPKPLDQNAYVFLSRAKDEFKKGRKVVLGQVIENTKYYSKPTISSRVIGNASKGKRIIIKGVVEQNGNAWYKIEEWMYIDASTVSFRSKK
ncbi:SH3 domain-containing protein [Campylobacter coli]|uniref:SH3 domain-containing protein n=1 Tax=Campylobacter coli TaxID=195 RepID=A0A644SA97_CAMCO|nr:SH3 domain-containing protein [Campylobacter coli]EAI3822950.1 SH3 domain-containing protein [Campylobacter coli]EAI5446323.1 SH3 domain-containing protein [Campylobacter coli]EAJ2630302.1 SH3 domain-containing protein [Campylobacter coli]EAJ9198112.1 SH3 domain-containing protein [Campylobacter coli]